MEQKGITIIISIDDSKFIAHHRYEIASLAIDIPLNN